MSEQSEPKLGRRNFLKGAAIGGMAAAVTVPQAGLAAEPGADAGPPSKALAPGNGPRPTTAEEQSPRAEGLTYSQFMHGLKLAGIELDRKVLADIAMHEGEAFTAIIAQAKAALPQAA